MRRLIFMMVLLSLGSCGQADKKQTASKPIHEMVIEEKTVYSDLYFSGTVEPYSQVALTSPVDAVVTEKKFNYGQSVKAGQVLVVMDSSQMQKEYSGLLAEYLKAKDIFDTSQAKFVGTQNLWQAGLIPKNNYISERSSLNNANVSFLQAREKLSNMLAKLQVNDGGQLFTLDISQTDAVNEALKRQYNVVALRAQKKGLILQPPKEGDKSNKLSVGGSVKRGQTLALIGDMSGISIPINISEVDLEKIHVGQRANVSGVAFSGLQLTGYVSQVNYQATHTQSNGSGLPVFGATVVVPKLSVKQAQQIRVGMSAKIKLIIESPHVIEVPIEAVQRHGGQTFISKLKPSGKTEKVAVVTGATQINKVIITSGLKPGDKIQYMG